jgi:hypothetical protein
MDNLFAIAPKSKDIVIVLVGQGGLHFVGVVMKKGLGPVSIF